tara:strand:- start:640 stop:1296 length:657 start_codon:yes stop_codon:yes gene_type:complete
MATLCDQFITSPGLEVELGTGAGFFKKIRPALITSDVRRGPGIDMELDAQAMNLNSSSVRCVYAINVFHHLPDPEKFFDELYRVLKPGGGCILVEPHGGFASALLHRHLHKNERYDLNTSSWQTSEIAGPLSGANQALAEIIFRRDLAVFKKKYNGKLNIVHRDYELNALRYFFSGGLNFRQLAPSFMENPMKKIEKISKRYARHWSLHQIIIIQKQK